MLDIENIKEEDREGFPENVKLHVEESVKL